MYTIKFGTDGWRAIIAKEYTLENVRRIAQGTLYWLQQKSYSKVVIGHDCRFGGEMFLNEIAAILSQGQIECLIARGFVSTPMVSLGVVKHKAQLGIVITASHNPPEYNGFKLKSLYGGPSQPHEIEEVEKLIPDVMADNPISFEDQLSTGKIKYIDLEGEYIDHLRSAFDLNAMNAKIEVAYDAMYGAGQNAMKKLFPKLKAFHCEENPGFGHTAPEPIAKNLTEITAFLQGHPGQYIGIANDGDADRLAILDTDGSMIDSHHVLLLLLHYLAGYKKQKGKVVVSFSVTNKLQVLAEHYGLELVVTKIGFKYIAEYMISDQVLVGGEESGGLAIAGHIPERDGIWIALTLMQFMIESGKSLRELINEIYAIVGPFEYDRLDLHLNDEKLKRIKEKLQNDINDWGGFQVIRKENIDGAKYYFDNDAWLMIRTSGTEPVIRIYAQSENKTGVQELFSAAKKVLEL